MSDNPNDTEERTGSGPSLTRFFALLLVLGPVLITARFHIFPEQIQSVKQLTFMIFGGLFYLSATYRNSPSLGDGRILISLLAIPVIGAIGALSDSYGWASPEELALLTTYLLVFLGAGSESLKQQYFPRALLIACLPVTGHVLFQTIAGRSPLTTGLLNSHQYGTMLGPGQLHGFLIFSVPFLLWFTLNSERRSLRIVSGLTVAAAVAVLLLHRSVFACAVLLGSLSFAGLLLLVNTMRTADAKTETMNFTARTLLKWFLPAAGSLFMIATIWSPASVASIAGTVSTSPSKHQKKRRVVAWYLAGITYRSSHPFGSGPGSFEHAMKPDQSAVLQQKPFRSILQPPERIGNQYLKQLAEFGIAGCLALIVFFTLGLHRQVVQMYRRNEKRAQLFAAGTASVLAFVLFSFVYDLFSDPVTGGLFILFLGWTGSGKNNEKFEHGAQPSPAASVDLQLPSWTHRVTWCTALLLVAGLVYTQTRHTISRGHLERGRQLLEHPPQRKNGEINPEQMNRQAIHHLLQAVRWDSTAIDARLALLRQFNKGVLSSVLEPKRAENIWREQIRFLRKFTPHDHRLYAVLAARAENDYRSPPRKKTDYEKAVRYYKKAIRLHPNYHDGYRNLAWLVTERDRRSAIRYYEESLKIKPDHSEVLRNLFILRISLLKEKKQYQKAIDLCRETLRKHPNDQTLQTVIQLQMKTIRERMSSDDEQTDEKQK